MTIRFYLVPKIGDGLTPLSAFRPKYTDPDSLGAGWNLSAGWRCIDFGQEPVFLLVADVLDAEHTLLASQPDVTAFPVNLDNTIPAANLATVQTAMESMNLPADWVTTGHTYRQVLRMVRKMLAFAQRFNGIFKARIFEGITLSTRINQIPAARRNRLADTATNMGLDTSGITGTMTIRQALRILAEQVPDAMTGGDE